MTFTAQNIGAGKIERIKKGIVASGSISVLTVVVISTVLLAGGETALGWFGKDPSVIEIGLEIIAISFPFYWLNSLIEVFSHGLPLSMARYAESASSPLTITFMSGTVFIIVSRMFMVISISPYRSS